MRYGTWLVALAVTCVIAGANLSSVALAQDAAGDIKQMVLTEKQIQQLIAAQPDLAAIAMKLDSASESEHLGVEKELDAIAAKHGFESFVELDDVSANVQIVLDGLDPETGEYTDPVEELKQELADVKADDSMAADEKKALVGELEEALAAIPPLEHKENIALVKKYQKEIQEALDAGASAPQ